MSGPISCVVVSGTSSIPSWQITTGDAGTRTAIGCDPTVAWQFSAGEVQPKHAELYFDGAALYVCDLVNMGDVLIGGQTIAAGQWVPVPVGSELSIGQARLRIQQGGQQSIPPAPAKSRKPKKASALSQLTPRTYVMGGVVALALLLVVGFVVFKKLRASSQEQTAPVARSAAARTNPRAEADNLFPTTNSEIRTRDDFSKRTDPEAQQKVESKEQSEGSSGAPLERPVPTTLEGKAAAAAIDGDLTEARALYGQLVSENPSHKAFRVSLEIVERQRLDRCRQLGDTKCE